jgi:hypothetical protein
MAPSTPEAPPNEVADIQDGTTGPIQGSASPANAPEMVVPSSPDHQPGHHHIRRRSFIAGLTAAATGLTTWLLPIRLQFPGASQPADAQSPCPPASNFCPPGWYAAYGCEYIDCMEDCDCCYYDYSELNWWVHCTGYCYYYNQPEYYADCSFALYSYGCDSCYPDCPDSYALCPCGEC